VVWVDVKPNLKTLNPDKTYIVFGPERAINYRTVSMDKDIAAEQKESSFFYLYYHDREQKPSLKDAAKNEIREFFRAKSK
jgi:hypothetical protein